MNNYKLALEIIKKDIKCLYYNDDVMYSYKMNYIYDLEDLLENYEKSLDVIKSLQLEILKLKDEIDKYKLKINEGELNE